MHVWGICSLSFIISWLYKEIPDVFPVLLGDKNVDAEVPNEEELIPVLTEEIVPLTNTLHSELRSG